ncbi:winged helix-turn-helix transcriptional regulator [Pseudonocardia pini]|uniref:winged helix-turn-helix transcriptional regulator n=1 Tax=Pseudonocardia pini TaxID=2758030 RepID=UPI0015F005C3|nr:helix-turn-helix domain-containing protein [Pseudonocardia pini]
MSAQVEAVSWPGPGDAFDSDCPARVVLDHITSKWAVLVLVALLEDGETRFSALRRRVGGVSEKMLAQTLRTLEGDGFVVRTVVPSTPPQVSYALTDLGRDLTLHLSGLIGWINARVPEIVAGSTR